MQNAERNKAKREEAEKRNEKWQSLSFEEQLQKLDLMFGPGKGATKQRLKIHEKIKIRDSSSSKKKSK